MMEKNPLLKCKADRQERWTFHQNKRSALGTWNQGTLLGGAESPTGVWCRQSDVFQWCWNQLPLHLLMYCVHICIRLWLLLVQEGGNTDQNRECGADKRPQQMKWSQCQGKLPGKFGTGTRVIIYLIKVSTGEKILTCEKSQSSNASMRLAQSTRQNPVCNNTHQLLCRNNTFRIVGREVMIVPPRQDYP